MTDWTEDDVCLGRWADGSRCGNRGFASGYCDEHEPVIKFNPQVVVDVGAAERKVEDLEDFAIAGSYELDSKLWKSCDDIIVNARLPRRLRVRALMVVNNICGDTMRPSDLEAYAQMVRHNRSCK